MTEKNIRQIRNKIKKLSENLDKNYYEILNIYKELVIEYYSMIKYNGYENKALLI
jgi:hypothetical protein